MNECPWIVRSPSCALRYTARLLEAVGTDRVLAIDVHDVAAFENAFRLPTAHLETAPAFAQYFLTSFGVHRQDFAVVAPDPGDLKRAQRFRNLLGDLTRRDVPVAVMGKLRLDHVVGTEEVAGGVHDRIAILIDDMIATGASLRRCDARAFRRLVTRGPGRRRGTRKLVAIAGVANTRPDTIPGEAK